MIAASNDRKLTTLLKMGGRWLVLSIGLSVVCAGEVVANDNTTSKHKVTQITAGQCYLRQQNILLDLSTQIIVNDDPIAALKSGLTLHFAYEFRLEEADKWFAHTVELKREFRLRYNPVAQTFVYEDPITLKQVNHNSLEEALVSIGSFTALPLLDVQQLPLSPEADGIDIHIRFLLNEDMLPVSLRFSALIDKNWDIKSDWWSCRVDV